MKNFLLVTSLTAFLALGTTPPDNRNAQPEDGSEQDKDAFPITVDFYCPRNFGFHIGDEILLTVTLEIEDGPVVDLVNLPQKGEIHGSFEVRELRVHKGGERGRTVYTVIYQLQSFEPAISVDRVQFPPLRISYATEKDWNPVASQYHYQSLYSQPFDIYVSRTATYFGPMKDIKGPIADKRASAIGSLTAIVGGLLLLAALLVWPIDFFRKRKRVWKESLNPTARDCALKALKEARERCFNYEDHRKRLFFEINTILRDFLKDVYGLSTANKPSIEMVNQLRDRPFYSQLKDLVVRINQVIYEGKAPADLESILRQFTALLERIEGTTQRKVPHDKVS